MLDILSFYKHQFVLYGLDTQKFDASYCAGILNELTPMFESGALKAPAISERYQLSEAAKAYSRVRSGVGKIVFVMPEMDKEFAELTAIIRSRRLEGSHVANRDRGAQRQQRNETHFAEEIPWRLLPIAES